MITTCIKCKGTFFELKTIEPNGSNFKVNVVQCSACGSPIGLVDYYDTHSSIELTNSKIKNLHDEVSQIAYDVENVKNIVSRLR